ncbi:hypothetical protein IEQ34_023295 [Dendrobium chrysotoxum]|uniref:ATP synthase subunit 9, mitochondrial n=1 Tax=Dendrobium chrysotoxum TaxID=161865 RepID=A0AAV7FVL9_DENCH|nr:hypothetical protein IEQ34_023295 [Dendrobium chrysotoxum]
MGAGAATIASAGAAVGIGNVFSSLIHSVARNPSLAKQSFGYAILGFALTEAIASFAPMMASLISFVFRSQKGAINISLSLSGDLWLFVLFLELCRGSVIHSYDLSYGRKQGSWLIKMDSNDRVIEISRPRHRKRLPIARKFSAIWGTWMVSKKQLIKKLVNFRMIDGKRTRARAIVYQTFHRPARTERDVIKLMVDAVDNIKPICEVVKVGVAARDRQQTLAIRWILGAAFKRRISYRISLEKCSFAEILDAYRKRGIARQRRENLHGLASTNRSFAHFRWW